MLRSFFEIISLGRNIINNPFKLPCVHNVKKQMFSCSFLQIDDFFGNLPLFISEISWATRIIIQLTY